MLVNVKEDDLKALHEFIVEDCIALLNDARIASNLSYALTETSSIVSEIIALVVCTNSVVVPSLITTSTEVIKKLMASFDSVSHVCCCCCCDENDQEFVVMI
jgi:hypothetical protein